MSYSTEDDLLKHVSEDTLIQLTDDAGMGIVDADRLADAIADADAVIDGYLSRRYSVPMNPVPPLVVRMSADIALYNLYCRRPGTMPEERQSRYDAALAQLKDLSKGIAMLSFPEAAVAIEDAAQMITKPSVFSGGGSVSSTLPVLTDDGFQGY